MRIAILAAPRVSDPSTGQVPLAQARLASELAEALACHSDQSGRTKMTSVLIEFHGKDSSQPRGRSREREVAVKRIASPGGDFVSLMASFEEWRRDEKSQRTFDIVCAGTLETGILSLALRESGVAKRVVYIASHLLRPMRHWGASISQSSLDAECRCLQSVDATVFPSRTQREQYYSYYRIEPAVRTELILNPTPGKTRTRSARKTPVRSGPNLLMASPFHHQSDYPTALFALRRIVGAQGEAVRLRIAGAERHDSQEFLETAISLNVLNNIDFLGFLKPERMRQEYRKAHVTIVSSVLEAFGNVVPESLAEGTPVVATDVGAASHFIRGPLQGRIVPPRSPWVMADNILEIVDELQRPDELGHERRPAAIRKALVRIPVARVAEQYKTLLNELTSPKHDKKRDHLDRSRRVRLRLRRRLAASGLSISALAKEAKKAFESGRRLFDEAATPTLRWRTLRPVAEKLGFSPSELEELQTILSGDEE